MTAGVSAPEEAPAVLRIAPADADLARLYPWLEDAAATLPPALRNGMHVALEEVVMNVAMHGFAPGQAGEITIRLCRAPDSAALVVEDSGHAFDPTAAAAPARATSLEEAVPGGLGLTLLRHYCRDIAYERVDGRNRLTLRFPLPS